MTDSLPLKSGCGTIFMCFPTSTSEAMLREVDEADAWRRCSAASIE
jgi:hypothetical protein